MPAICIDIDNVIANSGTKCYLIRHPWNRAKQALPGVHWVADGAELAPRLLALADAWEKG